MIEQIIRWIILVILFISAISLIVVFQLDYVADALLARALPLAVVVGLSAIAASILQKK